MRTAKIRYWRRRLGSWRRTFQPARRRQNEVSSSHRLGFACTVPVKRPPEKLHRGPAAGIRVIQPAQPPAEVRPLVHVPRILQHRRRVVVGRGDRVRAVGRRGHVDRLRRGDMRRQRGQEAGNVQSPAQNGNPRALVLCNRRASHGRAGCGAPAELGRIGPASNPAIVRSVHPAGCPNMSQCAGKCKFGVEA